MGSYLSATVLGALLLFSPSPARQTVPTDLNISQQNIKLVTNYAYNHSSHFTYKHQSVLVSPVQVAREQQIEQKTIQVQTGAYERTKPLATPAPVIPTPRPQPVAGPAELETLVERYAAQYGARKDIMMMIMKCESGYNPNASNGSFAGLFQFMSSTWISNRNAMGLNPDPALRYNAEEAIRTAAFKMGRDGYGAWPACSAKAFNQLGV